MNARFIYKFWPAGLKACSPQPPLVRASRMRRLFWSKKQISATGHTTLPEPAQFPVDAHAKHVPNKKALAVSRKG